MYTELKMIYAGNGWGLSLKCCPGCKQKVEETTTDCRITGRYAGI